MSPQAKAVQAPSQVPGQALGQALGQAKETVCLAMIVRDEASVIQRALLSVRPYIDCWVIHDLGSTDDTCEIIQNSLVGIEGKLEHHTLEHFGEARNRLLASASQYADTVLMLDADEELQSIISALALPKSADVGLIDVVQADYTLRLPRLFRGSIASSALPVFRFGVGEVADLSEKTVLPLSGVSIQHHQDGIRHRQGYNEVAFVDRPSDLENPEALALNRGQIALRRGDHHRALSYFNAVCDSSSLVSASNTDSAATRGEKTSVKEFWQASYLAGNIKLALGETEAAVDLLRRSFDSAPERAEPLMRLAELHFQHSEHKAAKALCELIVDMPVPVDAGYVEPKAYSELPEALLKEIEAKGSDTQPSNEAANETGCKDSKGIENNNSEHQPELIQSNPRQPKLTIGMATYDDYDGVYFSVISLVLYHTEYLDQFEILIIDNNPDSEHGKAVRGLCDRVEQARYVAAGEYKGTAVRERIFAEAKADFVLGMDCHVFLHSGVVGRLLQYIEDNPDSKDLMHGPIFYDDLGTYSTHMEPIWNAGFYGTWGIDERGKDMDGEPFDIPLQGMGLFACFKSRWLGFNPRFRGFGGEEGYIHEKFRQHGGRVLCLPFLRWTHRFDRPNGTKYTNVWDDRIRNYLIGWHELGLDPKPVLDHFAEHVNLSTAAKANARFLTELNSGLWPYDTIYCLCGNEQHEQKILADLSTIAVDKVVQLVEDSTELPRLLRTAIERQLNDVVILDARNGAPEQAHVFLPQLVAQESTADVMIKSVQLTNEESGFGGEKALEVRAYLIRANAFESTAQCLESNGVISQDLLASINRDVLAQEICD